MKKPNLFVVGAVKAGTTTIYDYLCDHPDIFMSPIKEPGYFCTDIRRINFTQPHFRKDNFDIEEYLADRPLKRHHIAYIDRLEHYESLFADAADQLYAGESSGAYLYSSTAAQAIYAYNPEAKIIVSLRDPVDRAYSHWKMNIANGRESEKIPFIECVAREYSRKDKAWGVSHLYVDLSLYYTQIKRYLDIFPEKSVHIALYEDLNKSPQCFMDNIFSFLELRSITVNQQRRSNPSRKQRFPSIRKLSRKYNLTQYFSRDLVERIKRVSSVDDFPRLSQAEKKMIYETYFKDEMIKLPTLLKSKLNPLWRI